MTGRFVLQPRRDTNFVRVNGVFLAALTVLALLSACFFAPTRGGSANDRPSSGSATPTGSPSMASVPAGPTSSQTSPETAAPAEDPSPSPMVEPPAVPTVQPPPAPTVEPPPGPPAPGGPPPLGSAPVIWLPAGPAFPEDPPPSAFYLALQGTQCAGLPHTNPRGPDLWVAAAFLCSALESKDETMWAKGAMELAQVPRPTEDTCLALAAYDALNRLIIAHQDHPKAEVELIAQTGRACQLRLTGVSASQNGAPESLLSSSVCGGESVWLVGILTRVNVVVVGQQRVPVQITGTRLFFKAPPVQVPGDLAVTAESSAGRVQGTATIRYQGDPRTCLSPPPPPSPSPSPSN
ncbi:hypothetical protein Arth_1843 [Arthrobacter sp. FB24]|nr:hypothetical protein Arth_1843 [Arthrobacter sp. FB24]